MEPFLKKGLQRALPKKNLIVKMIGRKKRTHERSGNIEPEFMPRRIRVGGVIVIGIRRNQINVAGNRFEKFTVDHQRTGTADDIFQHRLAGIRT